MLNDKTGASGRRVVCGLIVVGLSGWPIACNETYESAPSDDPYNAAGDRWLPGPTAFDDETTNDPTDDPDPETPPPAEVCDGWDNDGDGQVDEETSGLPCELPTGGTGKTSCVQGSLSCEACTLGTVHREFCGCGTDRVDTCGPDRAWRLGACEPRPRAPRSAALWIVWPGVILGCWRRQRHRGPRVGRQGPWKNTGISIGYE